MPSLKETKRRIGSVKNTQKITRAMKLVASAKYARSNINLTKSRPYAEGFCNLVRAVLSSEDLDSGLLQDRPRKKKAHLIVVSADRGLCGSLNSGLFKMVSRFLEGKKEFEWSLDLWGKRAVMFGASRPEAVEERVEKVLDRPDHGFAKAAFERLSGGFQKGQFDEVYVAYPSFVSAISQPPVVKKILPLTGLLPDLVASKQDTALLFEPSPEKIIDPLLVKFGAVTLFQFLLEAATAEHAARVAAMDSATSNADKVIKDLTLQYNRARQASITTELIEITSGAEAL